MSPMAVVSYLKMVVSGEYISTKGRAPWGSWFTQAVLASGSNGESYSLWTWGIVCKRENSPPGKFPRTVVLIDVLIGTALGLLRSGTKRGSPGPGVNCLPDSESMTFSSLEA
jgi:hypothetical protein